MQRARKIVLVCAAILASIAGLATVLWWLLSASHAELEPLIDIADLCLKTFSALAVLIGGAWGFYKYIIAGSASWMCNISLDTEVLLYRDDLRLLVIHVRSTNPRTSKFEFDKPNSSFKLDVRLLAIDHNAPTIFDEEDGQTIARIDFLESIDGGYEMLPAATMDDMRTFVLPVNTIVSMTAELRIRRWWQTDDDLVSTSSVVRIAP
jgi:hypothetical protein